jgi:branched-chain amino acid transport system substrate-binding protein
MNIFFFLLLMPILSLWAKDKVIYIYQDADLSNHKESSEAIQKGIEVAFNEIGNHISEYKIIFKYLDHRGNVIRSKRNYQQFIDDPNALAIYSGIHSPPLIKNRTFINENKALTLVPWAAGGPITRYPFKENWVFRLSVDDTRAGPVIIDYAMNTQECEKPHLLLEKTPWGDSNLQSMSKALKKYNLDKLRVTRFSWNLKAKGARIILNEIVDEGSDCIILVSNAVEGAVLVKEMYGAPSNLQLPIVSHWGITGGNFHEVINADMRENLELHFIQSCFAFTNPKQSQFSKQVFAHLTEYSSGTITKAADLKSAVGFIHAYDLTKLLIAAIKQANLTGNILADRHKVRLALENLNSPIKGLIKTYVKPFSEFDEQHNTNAHEALGKENYCMGKFGIDDEILISYE